MLLRYAWLISLAPDKVHNFISKMPISSPNPMFDTLLESSRRDDSNKWSNIGFGEEITQLDLIEVKVHLELCCIGVLYTDRETDVAIGQP